MGRLLPAALLLFIGLLSGLHLMGPWDDTHLGWGGAYYSTAARNLLRYPLSQHLGAMIVSPGPPQAAPELYFNHPPMIAWLVAAARLLPLPAELAARLVPWSLSLGAAGALWALLRRAGAGAAAASAGLMLACLSPMWLYFAALVDPQGSGVQLSILALCALALPLPSDARGLGACAAAALFGLFFDWPAWMATALVALWARTQAGGRPLARTLGLCLLGTLGLLLLWIPLTYQLRGGGHHILDAFVHRMGAAGLRDDSGQDISLAELLRQIVGHHWLLFSPLLDLGGLVGAVALLRRRRPADLLALVPLAAGLLHVLLFPQGAHVHAYWQFYLAAGLALPMALGLPLCFAPARQPAAGALLVGLGLVLGLQGLIRAEVRHAAAAPRAGLWQELGAALAALPEDRNLSSPHVRIVQVEHYADRPILWSLSPSAAHLSLQPSGAAAPEGMIRLPGPLPQGWTLWGPPGSEGLW